MNPLEFKTLTVTDVKEKVLVDIPVELVESWAICNAAGLTQEMVVGKAMDKYVRIYDEEPKLMYIKDDNSTENAVPIWVAMYRCCSSVHYPRAGAIYFCVVYLNDPDESGRIAEEGFQAENE